MLSISDSAARKNKLFLELKALSTSSLSRECLPLHQKLSFLCSLHCPDADPIKKGHHSSIFRWNLQSFPTKAVWAHAFGV